jgi:hypothetical protein
MVRGVKRHGIGLGESGNPVHMVLNSSPGDLVLKIKLPVWPLEASSNRESGIDPLSAQDGQHVEDMDDAIPGAVRSSGKKPERLADSAGRRGLEFFNIDRIEENLSGNIARTKKTTGGLLAKLTLINDEVGHFTQPPHWPVEPLAFPSSPSRVSHAVLVPENFDATRPAKFEERLCTLRETAADSIKDGEFPLVARHRITKGEQFHRATMKRTAIVQNTSKSDHQILRPQNCRTRLVQSPCIRQVEQGMKSLADFPWNQT